MRVSTGADISTDPSYQITHIKRYLMTEIPIHDWEREQEVAVVSDNGGYITIRSSDTAAEDVLREIFDNGNGGVLYTTVGDIKLSEDELPDLEEMSEQEREAFENDPNARYIHACGVGRVGPGEDGFGGALADALPSPYEVPEEKRRELTWPDTRLKTTEEEENEDLTSSNDRRGRIR